MRSLLFGCILLAIVACDSSRIFEENHTLENDVWLVDSIEQFSFLVTQDTLEYNVYANFTNKLEYPYYNLYYHYWLTDSTGKSIKSGLLNATLFDPKSGEPRGAGIGELFDHRTPIVRDIKFPFKGEFSLALQQYMRKDTLQGVRAVGARVEISE